MRAILFFLLTSYVFAESNFDFSKKFSGTFNGKKLEYTAKVYEKVIFERDDSTKPLASFVVTEYSVSNQKNRPVMFSFNGGPGDLRELVIMRSAVTVDHFCSSSFMP